MEQSTVDDLAHIQRIWPAFERLVGLRGRKMYARVDGRAHSYTVCTPLKSGEEPSKFGLEVGVLPGGTYLRGRLTGGPPTAYEWIAPGMRELERLIDVDESRPLVEFYRRHNQIELWVPLR